jgi:DNA-binding beta-propeller fold protein YncE
VAHPQIAVFARMADGQARTTRAIEGQKTFLGRTMHGIDYDPVHDEITVPQQFGQAILTFRGDARGEQPPIRILQGPLTDLVEPDRVTVDPVNNEIYVPDSDFVFVYPRGANGNVAPIRRLDLDDFAGSVVVDPVRNLLLVLSKRGEHEGIFIFDRTASGHAAPKAIIAGPKTELRHIRSIALYPPTGAILAVEQGVTGKAEENVWVGVWNVKDSGDVPPRWKIGGPSGSLRDPRGVTLDPEHKTVIVTDKVLNAVMTYSYPELFEAFR